MATRSDQVHSHQFVRQRVSAALALRDPDSTATAHRRAGALLAGALVALLALAAAAGYGVLRPAGDSSWRDGHALVIDSDTGARYLYRDGVLHPVLNYVSAQLILGSAQPARVLVARSALAGVPLGPPLGIAEAPDPLPAVPSLLRGAWTLCSRPAAAGGAAQTLLAVGVVTRGAPVADRAVLVTDPTGRLTVLWHGHRHRVSQPGIVLTGLGWQGQQSTPVAAGFLSAIPAGADLAPIHLADLGRASALGGRRVGTVVVVTSQSGARQYGVALSGGLAAITQLQADLLLADPVNAGVAGPVAISAADYADTPSAPSMVPAGDGAPPAATPVLAHPGPRAAVCASIVDDVTAPSLAVADPAPSAPGQTRVAGAGADWVAVPPGRGAVVESAGALGIVSDRGLLFPVPAAGVLATLGYAGVRPQRLPAALLALLPIANPLDPTVAGAG